MKTEPKKQPEEASETLAQINARVAPALKRRVKICAELDDKTMEEWVSNALSMAVEVKLKGAKLPFKFPAAPFTIRMKEMACATI